jgi:hypothetical protein
MLTQEERKEQRQNYVVPQPEGKAMGLMSVAAGTKYANGLYLLDVSSYQAKADKTTNVDWDEIAEKAPWIIGGYCKLGEVCDTIYSKNEDDSLDLSFKTNVEGMRRNHMLCGAYIYLNSGLFGSQMGMGLDDYANWRRPTESETLAVILNDPQLHLILRQIKVGFGRSPNPADIRAMPTRDIHFMVLDVEKYKVFYGNVSDRIIPDYEIGLNARVTREKLQWLMDNNYIPQLPILLYSGGWYVDSYGKLYLRTVADQMDTICAGYFWGMTYTPTTLEDIRNVYLPQIPDTWHPPLFGGAESLGKRVDFFQITGDKFAVAEVLNDNNQRSAIDLNYCNFSSLEEIVERFPLWVDSAELGTIAEPSVPPTPVETKTYATTNRPVNMRKDPSTNQTAVALLPTGTKLEVVDTLNVGSNVWRKVHYECWVADTVSGTHYLTITEE